MIAKLPPMDVEEALKREHGTLENRFDYHPPTSDAVVQAHQMIRASCLDVARMFTSIVPPSRELSLALTKLEESMYHANAGIARISNYESSD